MNEKIIVLFPGSFKPMHEAHLSLIKKYAESDKVKEVQVLIGPGVRNGIDQELAFKIAKKLTNNIPKVKLLSSEYSTPILTAYKIIECAEPGTYCLASSSKDNDYKRVKAFVKEHQPGGKYHINDSVKVKELQVDVSPTLFKNRLDEYKNEHI